MRSTILLALICLSTGWSQGTQITQERQASLTEDTKTVIATGIGIDHESALKQGLRSAVEQAIGVYMKSESVVENFELISDKILSHSRGYVKSYEIIRERSEGGLINMSISAEVIVKQLEITLIELNLYSKEIEGKSLFAEAATKITEARSAANLFRDLRDKYPRNAIVVSFGEPEIFTDASDIVVITIPYTLAWNEAFLVEIVEVLEQTSHAIVRSDREKKEANAQYPLKSHARIDLNGMRYYAPLASAKELVYRIGGDEYSDVVLLDVFVSLDDKNGNPIATKLQRGRMGLLKHKISPWRDSRRYFEFITSPKQQNHRSLSGGKSPHIPAQFRISLEELKKIAVVSGYAVNPKDK